MAGEYAYETLPVKDGDAAFGIEGTARISDVIYVLRPEADGFLLNALAASDYLLTPGADPDTIHVERAHNVTPHEIIGAALLGDVAMPLSLTVDLRYADGHRHALTEPDIHETILRRANQRSNLGYYNRADDRIADLPLARMDAFVRHMVDVDYARWQEFAGAACRLHAQDFVKSLAAWASRHSDGTPRRVRVDLHGADVTVLPTDWFAPRAGDAGWRFAP